MRTSEPSSEPSAEPSAAPSAAPSAHRRDALTRLEQDGLLRRDGERYRTTRRWQGALARAALRLAQADGAARREDDDLRVPVAHAVVELYGADRGSDELAGLVEALVLVEAGALTLAQVVRP